MPSRRRDDLAWERLKTILAIIVSAITIAGALYALWTLAKQAGAEEEQMERYRRTTDITVEKLIETNQRLSNVEETTERIERIIIQSSKSPLELFSAIFAFINVRIVASSSDVTFCPTS
jgi:hypothetical protein